MFTEYRGLKNLFSDKPYFGELVAKDSNDQELL